LDETFLDVLLFNRGRFWARGLLVGCLRGHERNCPWVSSLRAN
jgi:hypothetical protein